jgi:hypothetical protein
LIGIRSLGMADGRTRLSIYKGAQRGCAASFFGVEGAYTQQGRAHIRCLHPDEAARPALVRRAAHARRRKQSRGPHRSRRQPTPLPGLRCGARLARRASPPRLPTPVVRSEGGVGAHPPVPFGLSSPPAAADAPFGIRHLVVSSQPHWHVAQLLAQAGELRLCLELRRICAIYFCFWVVLLWGKDLCVPSSSAVQCALWCCSMFTRFH